MKNLILAASLLALAACGSSDTTTFSISTGTNYVITSNANSPNAAFPNDDCNMEPAFTTTSPPIHLVVGGAVVQFDLDGTKVLPGDEEFFSTADIVGNEINHRVGANFDTTVGTQCVYNTVYTVNGDILANDQVHLVARYTKSVVGAAICSLADVDVKVLPCTSEVDFTAARQ